MKSITVLVLSILASTAMATEPLLASRAIPVVKTVAELRFPFPRQSESFTCAPASLAIASNILGIPMTEAKALEIMMETYPESKGTQERIKGFTMKHIVMTAHLIGVEAKGKFLPFEKLRQVVQPTIVRITPFNEPHFAVWLGMSGPNHVRLADPSNGLVRMPIARFLELWKVPNAQGRGVWIELSIPRNSSSVVPPSTSTQEN